MSVSSEQPPVVVAVHESGAKCGAKADTDTVSTLIMMSSSVLSRGSSSSLTSPVDSGVQLLDSENDLLSVMTNSGLGSDLDGDEKTTAQQSSPMADPPCQSRKQLTMDASDGDGSGGFNTAECEKLNEMFKDLITSAHEALQSSVSEAPQKHSEDLDTIYDHDDHHLSVVKGAVMTRSDIANQNVADPIDGLLQFSTSAPNCSDFFSGNFEARLLVDDSQPHSLLDEPSVNSDLMNISLNSYELLEYTAQNTELLEDQMHVSMSEEVNESLIASVTALVTSASASKTAEEHPSDEVVVNKEEVVQMDPVLLAAVEEVHLVPVDVEHPAIDEQIVYRRQRKKKPKADTPKKRVSFHEDILNSTKIDDIHINRGFITMEDEEVSANYFRRGFVRKPDVVEGRYSWAAEGDAPFYNKNPDRAVKSDIYVNSASRRYFSTSSSSSGSVTSSIDEEDAEDATEDAASSSVISDTNENLKKQPKSSCLKKNKNYIDTNIVEEDIGAKRRSDGALLDGNLFGSLKNILSFSSSVPERGVPEGQEDALIYSSSHDSIKRSSRPNSQVLDSTAAPALTPTELPPAAVVKPSSRSNTLNLAPRIRPNLRLNPSEGFHPHFPPNNLPPNVVLCDSNVYEHRGISYSYEYADFQRSFSPEAQEANKPKKASTMYQKILKEFNFFKWKASSVSAQPDQLEDDSSPPSEVIPDDDFELLSTHSNITDITATSTPTKQDNLLLHPNEDPTEADSITSSLRSKSINQFASTSKIDWSDNDTVLSDLADSSHRRHLHSPKRTNKSGASGSNHYSVQNNKYECTIESPISAASSKISGTASAQYEAKCLPNMRSKKSLIDRFLRHVTAKKLIDLQVLQQGRKKRHYMGLYVKGARPLPGCNTAVDQRIADEILTHRATASQHQPHRRNNDNLFGATLEQKLDWPTLSRLRTHVFHSAQETLLHIFCVHSAYTTSGNSAPIMLMLTTEILYIVSLAPSGGNFLCHFSLCYTDLNTVMVGPSAQTLHLANVARDAQCMLVTGCEKRTGDIVASLEMAVRKRRKLTIGCGSAAMAAGRVAELLPAVKQLTMRDMATLRKSLCKQTSIDKKEEYFYYSIVNLQEYNADNGDSPLGPNKEGPLMFKVSETESRWETAYFILKAGVLYMLSAPSNRVPMRVLPLVNGACQGARRVFSARPHTFQLTVNGSVMHLAAPDEYVASEWLQVLVQAASGNFNLRERTLTTCCTLLLTSSQILTVREAFTCNIVNASMPNDDHHPIKGATMLSCAAIADITAFRLPSAEQSWCVLEFACREVHETSGDWILYFASNVELENFISTLESLWAYQNENGDSFPLSTIPETDTLSKRCCDAYKQLQTAWPSTLLPFS